jgi:signal transduction histidine kinase
MNKNFVYDAAPPSSKVEDRLLIQTPTGRDSAMTCEILSSAGMECLPCRNTEEVCALMREGAGAVLLADETLVAESLSALLHALDEQESWSDIPLLVFPANGANAAILLERLGSRANVTILERPVHIEILINAAKSALRARRRQYETRNLLFQLENADRQKDLFLAMLSHELRTPLSAILGWSRLLQSGHLNAEKTALALQVINRNATAQAQLIADILSVSQIVAGTLRIDRAPLELEAVIRSAIDAVRPSAEAKEIRLEYRADSPWRDGGRCGAPSTGRGKRTLQCHQVYAAKRVYRCGPDERGRPLPDPNPRQRQRHIGKFSAVHLRSFSPGR